MSITPALLGTTTNYTYAVDAQGSVSAVYGPAPSQAPGVTYCAGIDGERQVTAVLADHLGDDWTLFRGYRNRGGEIDHLLLGARGLLAVEVKYRNATVHCAGDAWWFDKYDRYGNIVEQGDLSDRGGRSPSRQLNEAANALEAFLSSRGQAVAIRRIVLFTHARSALGTLTDLTVDLIGTSATHVIQFLDGLPPALEPRQLNQLEQLIVRDHRFHAGGRHRSRSGGPGQP